MALESRASSLRGLFLLASLGLAACSSGSGSSGSGASTLFTLQSISVPPASTWQLNRPIEFVFTDDVDFSTVNLNTIRIAQPGGAPAAGEFHVGLASDGTLEPRVIVFAPRCPTLPDGSDAGLQPGGIGYQIEVPSGGAPSLASVSGASLVQGGTSDFTTPASSDPALLFYDSQPGAPAPRIRTSATELDACYVELGGSNQVSDRVYFQPRASADPELGADVPAGFVAPLNLYSSIAEQVAFVLFADQSLDPSVAQAGPSSVRLEYQEGASWIPLAHTVELVANCDPTGGVLRVAPTGILPQDRLVRLVFSAGLKDLVGETSAADLVVGSFHVAAPGAIADEFREEFASASGADTQTTLDGSYAPRAEWGNGWLQAGFDFAGTGGPPDGQFDYEVGSSVVGSQPVQLLLDSTYTLITDTTHTRSEAVINGVMDVRNFAIHTGSSLTVIGPNGFKLYATGTVRIDGKLSLRGENSPGVSTLNTTCVSENGASGNAGGGDGGRGNPFTTQSSPKGEDGYGAFAQASFGGGGGHTAYRLSADEVRRPGGGGGGRLGTDVMEVLRPNCPDQSIVGLDAEDGRPGHPIANDAILGVGVKPHGGTKGPRPFTDADPTNDFYGVKLDHATGLAVQGELTQPWAGSGGGGGGNSCNTINFPLTPFICTGDEKGCGGGGGGGSLLVYALGDITFGVSGKIEANGGAGGGGENSLSGGITRIGGGSGGGSGGHVVLQSASNVDLSNCVVANGAGIFARGGQGGAGKEDAGGAHAPGTGPYSAAADALPPNSYPSTSASTECRVINGLDTGPFSYSFSNTVGNGTYLNDNTPMGPDNNVVSCAGGDGGPGIIQIHVARLSNTPASSDLKLPSNTMLNPLRLVVSPTPVGATPANLQTPGSWDLLPPRYGRYSSALSNWIPLGAADVSAGSATPHAVQFVFRGTDSGGFVPVSGGSVTQLPPILAGTLAAAPTLPHVAADLRTLVFDATGLDPIYLQNPGLMLRFGVHTVHGLTNHDYEVDSATIDSGTVRIGVSSVGTPFTGLAPGDGVSVTPRFFRVRTDGVDDALPAATSVRVLFQAAPADAQGNPSLAGATGWVADASAIELAPGAANFAFVRFRVDFDLLPSGAPLGPLTPRPQIDFLRLPFKF